MYWWVVSRGVTVLVVVCVLALFAGHVLGQPIVLGYVETGSMEPTLEAGDGFVAIPTALAGSPGPGDVVVYEAEAIEGGGLTTHRVVAETERGYVTHGDANPVTDQDAGEPPVTESSVVATAWRPGGSVLSIPHLGTAVMTLDAGFDRVGDRLAATFGFESARGSAGFAYVLLFASLVLFGVETIRERSRTDRRALGRRRRRRGRSLDVDPRLFAGGIALLVVVAATAAMIVPAGTQDLDVVSADFESDRPLVVERGTTDDVEYGVGNGGLVPTVSYVEPGSADVGVHPERVSLGPRSETDVTLSITAPEETGYYPTHVTEHRYLHVLPAPVLDRLYGVHPWVPLAAILSVLGGGTYAMGRLALGTAGHRGAHGSRFERHDTSGGRFE